MRNEGEEEEKKEREREVNIRCRYFCMLTRPWHLDDSGKYSGEAVSQRVVSLALAT